MKKIILTALNARYSHSNPALLYLRNAAHGLPFEIEIAEYSINQGVEEMSKSLAVRNPHAVALSVYIWNSLHVKRLIALLHEMLPETLIILGGPEVSFSARQWLEELPFIDFIISGKGEAAFRFLLESEFRYGEKIVSMPCPHFSEIPFPYREEDFARLGNKYIYYESSRGCPFRCSYCLSSRGDHTLEFRNMQDIEAELDFLSARGPRFVKFVDRTFNCSREHSRKIWRHIIENYSGGGTCFHFEIFPSLLEEEDFEILKQARPGLIQFEAGIQSIHDETLKAVNRTGPWTEIKPKLLRLLDETDIHLHVDLIAGLPFEDIDGIAGSFNEIYGLRAHHFQMGFLKVLPGTEIAERKDEFGLVHETDPPYTVTENRWLSRDDMALLTGIEEQLEKYGNSGTFETALAYLEELYPDSFSMFADMARRAAGTGSDPSGGWPASAERLLRFMEEAHTESAPLMLDCLRWDWCISGRSHRYPPVLIDEHTTAERKKVLAYLNTRPLPEGAPLVEGGTLKKTCIFSPKTPEFRERYLDGRGHCLFLPDGSIISFSIK